MLSSSNVCLAYVVLVAMLTGCDSSNVSESTTTAVATPQTPTADQAPEELATAEPEPADEVAEQPANAAAVAEVPVTAPSPEGVQQKETVDPQTIPPETPDAADTPYSVIDGKVDEDTYKGWQTYRVVGCGQCHGGTGQGGAAADLVARLKEISKEQFVDTVMNGKGLMSPWKGNPKVVDNMDRIYGYLKARSDGALGKEKPQKQ